MYITLMRNVLAVVRIVFYVLCVSAARCASAAGLFQQQQTAFQRGLAALQQDRTETALREFTNAESEQPDDAVIHNFRGIVLAKLGRTTEAADEYRGAIQLAPQFGAAYRNLGFLEWTEHRIDPALTQLSMALRLAPDDNFARYYLGRVELEMQQYDAAFRHLRDSAIPLPDDPDVLLRAARGYSALGRQAEEKALVNRLASMRLNGAQTALTAAGLVTLHEHNAATRLLQGWRQNNAYENGEWAIHDLALTYLLADRYQDAADQAHQIPSAQVPSTQIPSTQSKSEPSEAASASSLIGIANARLHQHERAVEAFRLAVSLAPSQEDHWLNLTRELMELSRFADAIAATQEAILAHPESYALQLRLGAAYLAVARYSDAEATFQKLIVAGDPLPTSSVGLAQVLLRTGRPDEAVAELGQARQRLGRSFLLSYFQGLACNRTGKSVEAAASFKEALEQDPQSAEAHFELGKAELKLGHFNSSVAELEKSLQLNGSNLPARRLLKQAYYRAGSGMRAEISTNVDTVTTDVPANAAEDFILPEWQNPAMGTTSKIIAAPSP